MNSKLYIHVIIFYFFVYCINIQAQNIDYKKFDTKKLEQLILENINKTRDSLQVKALVSKSKSLKKAADNHAEYLAKTGKLSHGQTDKKYKDHNTRIAAFGGKYMMTAENVAFIEPSSKDNFTEESLAKQFVNNWNKSLGHFKNLSNKNLQETAVSVFYDKAKNRFYAVQVFGTPELELSKSVKVPNNVYGIKSPGQDYFTNCKQCMDFYQSKPADVQYGFHRIGDDIYFMMTDADWLNKMFVNEKDGFAVDIIQRDQYICGAENVVAGGLYKGVLLPPIYLKDIKKIAQIDENHRVKIKAGSIPIDLRDKEIEFNFVWLSNNFSCHNTVFYDLPNDKWDLLPMSLLADLPESQNPEDTWLNKKMKFTIPFEKDKFTYKSEDIKPLYDSLKLTDYTIKSIKINAFASVEGTEQRNILLQQKRAESIVAALQAYQKETIKQEVSVSENWVEFFQDIENTPFSKFKSQSKIEIKENLVELKDNQSLEKILSKHRKAILVFELEKRTNFGSNPELLQAEFNKLVSAKKLTEAVQLQSYIYASIVNKILPATSANLINIPEKIEYGTLLNNSYVFKYETFTQDLQTVLAAFNKLQALKPTDPKINYNLTVLKIKKWLSESQIIENGALRKEIENLSKLGIEQVKVKRLLLNYHFILSEKLLAKRLYSEKDKALNYIYNTYKQAITSEEDYLALSRFFARYSKFDWSAMLLADKVLKVDVSEDLLFYYINLTLFDSKITGKPSFRTILLNASNSNKKRFCTMFKRIHSEEGAISFQLLGDFYLKKSYCEICEE